MILTYTCGVIEMLNDCFGGRAFDKQYAAQACIDRSIIGIINLI